VEINPNYPWGHHGLGVVYAQQGKLDEAIAEYETAIRINPNMAYAHSELEFIYRDYNKLSLIATLKRNATRVAIIGILDGRIFKSRRDELQDAKQIATSFLVSNNDDEFSIVERDEANLKSIFKELDFSLSDIIHPETALGLGQLLSADALVILTLENIYVGRNEIFAVRFRVIKTSTGEIIWNSVLKIERDLAFALSESQKTNYLPVPKADRLGVVVPGIGVLG